MRILDIFLRPQLIYGADTPDHLRTGARGEEDAYFYLRGLGYVIVARNWRTPGRKGEIDLIGWDGNILCFVEVKTRTTRDVKPAEAAVDTAKQRELRAMARQYLRRMPRSNLKRPGSELHQQHSARSGFAEHRFDVISVYYDKGHDSATDITLFRNAFSLS